MKRILLLIAFVVIFTPHFSAQNDPILASVGSKVITADEFKMRFELSPRVSYSMNQKVEKYEFLLTLLAEKVLALEGEKLNYQSNDEIQNRLYSIRKKYTLDKLYQEEIINNIEFTDEEIQNAVGRASITNYCKFLYSVDKKEIDSLYIKLTKGASFESLLEGRLEEQLQNEPVKVEFGMADIIFEDLIYSIPQGSFSKPYYKGEGWVIYYIKSKEVKYPDLSDNKFLKSVKDVLRQRKLSKQFSEYVKKHLSGNATNVDIKLFNALALAIYNNDIHAAERDTNGSYLLDYNIISGSRKKLSIEQMGSIFIKFDIKPINLGNFINEISVDGLIVDSLNLDDVKHAIDRYLKRFIRNEILYREALGKEYHLYPEVENILDIWHDNYLASMVRKKIVNEIHISYNGKIDTDKLYEELSIETAKIAADYEIKIFNENLSGITVNFMNMAAYKILGFGDNAIAVPYISKFDEWFEIMNELKKLESR